MGNVLPLFAAAPRIKVLIDQQVVAYAVGFNVAISVDVQPVFIVGQHGPISLEPTLYNTVTGTFQIVRLLSAQTQSENVTAADSHKSAQFSGNGGSAASVASPSSLDGISKTTDPTVAAGIQASNDVLNQKRLFQHLDPKQLLLSRTFNIRLHMKVPALPDDVQTPANSGLTEKIWFDVLRCRFTSRNNNISLGQLVNTPMSFQGLLATPVDPDTQARQFKLDSSVNNTPSG